jgi:hypothetical protein
VDPHDTGTIFMGTFAAGIRKSVDGGLTWSTANTGLTNLVTAGLAFDASGPQTAYAGTGGGLFKSADGGLTWQSVTAISGPIASLAADPNRSGVVYLSTGNNLVNEAIRKAPMAESPGRLSFPRRPRSSTSPSIPRIRTSCMLRSGMGPSRPRMVKPGLLCRS